MYQEEIENDSNLAKWKKLSPLSAGIINIKISLSSNNFLAVFCFHIDALAGNLLQQMYDLCKFDHKPGGSGYHQTLRIYG